MNETPLYFILLKHRAEHLTQYIGNRVSIEDYNEGSVKVIFDKGIDPSMLLNIFHAGVMYGLKDSQKDIQERISNILIK